MSTRRRQPSGPSRTRRNVSFNVEPEHLYKAVGLLFLFLVFYAHFDQITRGLLLVYAAAIVAIALNELVKLVPAQRRLVSVGLGLVIFAASAFTLWTAVPALAEQLRGLTAEFPRLQQQAEQLTLWLERQTGLNVELIGSQTGSFLRALFTQPDVLGTAWGLIEAVFLPVIILIGALFAVARPNERLLSPLLHVVPRDRRDDFRRLFELLGSRLRGWVKGALLSMVAVGALTALGLWVIGVRYSLLLGVISGLLEIIPFAGPFLAGAIAVSVAILDDPTLALWVALLMLVIQQLESNFITPLVMSRAAEVHPFVTLFALFFFGSLFGFLGIILSVPLVLLVWTMVEVLWVERAINAERDHIEPIVRE